MQNHYIAMLADDRRTSAYQQAIEERLAQNPPNSMTVLDIGPGPFAVLALNVRLLRLIYLSPTLSALVLLSCGRRGVFQVSRASVRWPAADAPAGSARSMVEQMLRTPAALAVCACAYLVANACVFLAQLSQRQPGRNILLLFYPLVLQALLWWPARGSSGDGDFEGGERARKLTVRARGAADAAREFRLWVDELAHAIVPEQCAWRVTKARRLVVSLRKADRYRSWGKLRMR